MLAHADAEGLVSMVDMVEEVADQLLDELLAEQAAGEVGGRASWWVAGHHMDRADAVPQTGLSFRSTTQAHACPPMHLLTLQIC
jgi:hypothetical protein